MKIFGLPVELHEAETTEEWQPGVRSLNAAEPRHVVTALANPETEGDLLRMGQLIAAGAKDAGRVTGLSIVKVPYQTPLSTIRRKLEERQSVRNNIKDIGERVKLTKDETHSDSAKALAGTTFEAVSEAAYNVFNGLIEETEEREADLMLMGWQGGFSIGRIYNSPVQKIIKNLKADVGILKDRGLDNIDSVLLPWGGGYHAQLGLEIGLRIARNLDAKLTILRLVKPGTVKENEQKELEKIIKPLTQSFSNLDILIRESDGVANGIDQVLKEGDYDLTIIGASHEWGIRNVLFGTITDIVADSAPCSVLMVRRYLTEDWKLKASESLKRMKEQLGMTSSPESDEK